MWWICLVPLLWQWYHRCMHMSKRINMYILNVCNFYISIIPQKNFKNKVCIASWYVMKPITIYLPCFNLCLKHTLSICTHSCTKINRVEWKLYSHFLLPSIILVRKSAINLIAFFKEMSISALADLCFSLCFWFSVVLV